jgi:hypothetical protein
MIVRSVEEGGSGNEDGIKQMEGDAKRGKEIKEQTKKQ